MEKSSTSPESEKESSGSKEAQPVLPQAASATPPPVVEKSNALPAKRSFPLIAIFSLIVAVIALAASAYLWQQAQPQQQQLQQARADLAGALQRLDALNSSQQSLQRELDRAQDVSQREQQALMAELQQLQQQLRSQHKRLMAMSTTDRDDWLLAEAEYLMRLANQRLLMGKELKGAQELLKAADSIIRELDDAALFAVREALAIDMEALRAAGKLDMEGLYLQLGALAGQLEQLKLLELPSLELPIAEPEAAEDWQQRFEQGISAAAEKLSQFIRITKRDEKYKPLLDPANENTIRQTIRLMLEQAQVAALAGKQQLYLDSLKKARRWLQQYYTLDQVTTESMLKAIDDLLAKSVVVDLPDISGSLRAIRDYVETIHAPARRASANEQKTVDNTQPSSPADSAVPNEASAQ